MSQNTSDKKSRKKLLFFILLPAIAILFSAGLIAAYFSDYFQDTGNITTDTLDIGVSHTVSLNGTDTSLDNITALNPGDVIVISGTVTNLSNLGVWARETLKFTPSDSALLPYLEIYDIEIPQSELLAETDYSTNRLGLTNGFWASGNKIVNGTNEAFQAEIVGDFNYIGTAQYDFAITIYFSHLAGNDAQNKTVSIEFTAQALQFKNNNLAAPSSWPAV